MTRPNRSDSLSLERRDFLRGGLGLMGALTLGGGASARVRCLGGPRLGDERTLVLVQLSGGNDGLSTLVPFGDDAYFEARKSTRVDVSKLHKLDEYRGLHPELGRLAKRFGRGQLALVQGVGYPGPNRSHFKSLDVWHTASLEGRASGPGWVGRLCDEHWGESELPELSVHLGKTVPYSLSSAGHPPVAFEVPETYRWMGDPRDRAELEAGAAPKGSVLDRLRGVMRDAQASSRRIRHAAAGYRPQVEYPDTDEGRALRTAAAMIDARLGSRVISVEFTGFDTHTDQLGRHSELMTKLDQALGSFLDDLDGRQAGEETLVLVFSEFGRRVKENGSRGTDHGKAGVLFAAGAPVAGGLYGEYPSLTELDSKDLAFGVDFRRVYSSAIGWLGGEPEAVLGERFAPVPFLS